MSKVQKVGISLERKQQPDVWKKRKKTSDFCILKRHRLANIVCRVWEMAFGIQHQVLGRFLRATIRALKRNEYIHIYIYIWYIYIYIYICLWYVCVHIYIPLRICIYTQLHSDVYMYIHMFICILYTCLCTPPPELGVQVHMLRLVGFVKAGLNWEDDFVQK